MADPEHIPLRQFIERVLDERDRSYLERFAALERSMYSALAAQKEFTTAAFAASQKAADRAEILLSEFKASSNEWRQALNDAYQNMKLETREYAERNLREAKGAIDKTIDEMKDQIHKLQESRSEHAGHEKAVTAEGEHGRWEVSTIISVIGLLVSIAAVVAVLAMRKG